MNILLSIHTVYADAIYDGKKLVEVRKTLPTKLAVGDKVYLYETSPKKLVTGYFTVNKVEKLDIKVFWKQYDAMLQNMMTDYISYLLGCREAIAISVDAVVKFPEPKLLTIRPPQSWCYTENL